MKTLVMGLILISSFNIMASSNSNVQSEDLINLKKVSESMIGTYSLQGDPECKSFSISKRLLGANTLVELRIPGVEKRFNIFDGHTEIIFRDDYDGVRISDTQITFSKKTLGQDPGGTLTNYYREVDIRTNLDGEIVSLSLERTESLTLNPVWFVQKWWNVETIECHE